MTSSRRASGTKRKRRSSRCAASSCRSTPCTSSVQPGVASVRQRATRDRTRGAPTSARRRARPAATRRRRARRARTGARGRRRAARRRQRAADEQRLLLPVPAHEGERPTDRRAGPSAGRGSMPHCAMIVRWKSAAPCVVSLTWRLADAQGAEIDELSEPVEFFYGGDDLLAKVEEALAGQETGFATTLHLEPEHAFGEYDPELVFFESRAIFPDGASSPACSSRGRRPAPSPPTSPEDAIYTVTEVYPDHVVLDGNHPLAGIALRLALVVRDVREATEEEVEAGSVGSSGLSVLAARPPGRTCTDARASRAATRPLDPSPARACWSPRRRRRRPSGVVHRALAAEAVEREVDHRRDVERDRLREDRPPTTARPSGWRSSAPAPRPERDRQRAHQRGQRRHHDRPEAQQAGLADRLRRRHALRCAARRARSRSS